MEKQIIEETTVSWNLDQTTIEGTLALPKGNGGAVPGIVLVAGSGPTDRNWNSPLISGTNGSGKLIAQELAGWGFATLRYDKRASGPHAAENMKVLAGKISMQSHLDEVSSAIDLLRARPEVDGKKVFILGNSEGCIHAMNYQVQSASPCLGIVLSAPPAQPVGKVAHNQMVAQMKQLPNGQELLQAYDQAMDKFVAGQPVEVDPNLPEFLRMPITAITAPFNQPFAHELWVLDPAAQLEKITAPVLIVIGKKDIQVDWQIEGPLFEIIAAQHKNISIAFPPDANHVMKLEKRPFDQLTAANIEGTYSGEDSHLDPEALQIIESWLDEQVEGLS
jgi:pimeloyl-ACP methyl ester carboxylesterase